MIDSSRAVSAAARKLLALPLLLAILLCAAMAENTVVPNLIKFSGNLAPGGTQSTVVFALYKDSTGGAPLWQESQAVALDGAGHYTVLLGARSLKGVPGEVFASGEARWLGVSVQGQPEQPRVLLVSVPYAMKAGDAESVGGVPASALVQRGELTQAAFVNSAAVAAAAKSAVVAATAGITATNATPNYVPVFTDANGDLGNSAIYQAASGAVGIGTTTPVTTLHLLATNPTMRMESYGPLGSGDSPNFNFYTANGTGPTGASATVAGDNLGQFAATGYDGANGATVAFGGSKVKIVFLATEGWQSGHNGTAIGFHTTTNGTTGRSERMRINHDGGVGIGTTLNSVPIDAPLTVVGKIHSVSGGTLTGGFEFPDGSVQSSAATPVPSNCAQGQMLKWNGTNWFCFTSPAVSKLTLTDSGLTGDVDVTAANTLTLGTNTTYLQKRVTGSCSSGSAVAGVNADGTVSCQTVSGGGAIALPVNWSSASNPPTTAQAVLNVANTAAGVPPPNNSPTHSFLASVPVAIAGAASPTTGVSAGLAGFATGSWGVGIFADSNGNAPTMFAMNELTGYVPTTTSNQNWPTVINAALMNAGGIVVHAESDAATAPPSCSSNNPPVGCGETVGVQSEAAATSGRVVLFQGNTQSPDAVGLQLNFEAPLNSGSIISANVNCGSTNANNCGNFSVDGSGNVNTSGTLNANGGKINNQLIVNSLTVNSQLNVNGQIIASGASINGQLNVNNLNVSGQFKTGGPSVEFFNNAQFDNGAQITGNLNVTGTLSKASGTFKIDHPLDPANKYLYHSFVESPDMMNIYNGVVVLDKRGRAVVEMPDYFEALNQNFRYQLTAVGAPGPNLYVAQEVTQNHFVIAGGKPGAKVSWQVTGIRHDAYANAHRVQVEEDKGDKRGSYLHPELFQQERPGVAQK